MRRLPPLNALRAFEAAARHSSVTAAAEELHVSHSAVSQQVMLLEQHFGQKLFERKGRRITPTPAAQAFLNDLRSAFDLIAVGSQQLAARSQGVRLSVNTTPSFALRWLIPKTSDFQLANPAIHVTVETSEKDGIDHLDQPYDVIIRRFPMERRGYGCFPLVDDISTVLASPAFLEQHPIKTVEDLRPLPLLHMKSRPEAWRRWFAQHGNRDSDVIAGPSLDHFCLTLQSAISGLGVALGPLCMVEEDLAANRLVAPLPDKTLRGPGFHMLVRENKTLARHREALAAALLGAAGRSAPRRPAART